MKSLINSAVGALTRTATNGPAWARRLMAFALAAVDDVRWIETGAGRIAVGVGNPIERWRADTLLSKEPETIAWLDRTVKPGSVLYDVGANIGVYALYAAHLHPGRVTVYCFEPEPLNAARLNRNIALNGLSGNILAFPLGLSDRDGTSEFRLSGLEAGRALHGERMVAPGAEAHTAGMVLRRLDTLLAENAAMARPTHLKIDVDGPEAEILKGAEAALAHPVLRHILIELETDAIDTVTAKLESAGFARTGAGEVIDNMQNVIFEKPAS
jgi:FkbM family methyltransferase